MNFGGNPPWARQQGGGSGFGNAAGGFSAGSYNQQQSLAAQPTAVASVAAGFSQQRVGTANVQQVAAAAAAAAASGNNKNRVFSGVVTKITDTFGFVDGDVFFQTSVCNGKVPKMGERVLVEASFNANMPFKWNATRVQVMPSQQAAAAGAQSDASLFQQRASAASVQQLSALQHAQATSVALNPVLNQGSAPANFWLIGSVIDEIHCPEITHKVSISGACLDELVHEAKAQLQSFYLDVMKVYHEFQPPFLIFAVGIYDLVPDKYPTNLVTNLDYLVQRERYLREEFGSLIANLAFTTVWPPSMARLGVNDIEHHAQQFVNIVFRFYNKWVMIINNYNRTQIIRMCRAFHANDKKYRLKVTQIKSDGYQPTTLQAGYLSASISKGIQKAKHLWQEVINENPSSQMMLNESWAPVKEAETVYLNALYGYDLTEHVVNVPFMSIANTDGDSNKVKMEKVYPNQKARGGKTEFTKEFLGVYEPSPYYTGMPSHMLSESGKPKVNLENLETVKQVTRMADECPDDLRQTVLQMVKEFRILELEIFEKRQEEDEARLESLQESVKALAIKPKKPAVKSSTHNKDRPPQYSNKILPRKTHLPPPHPSVGHRESAQFHPYRISHTDAKSFQQSDTMPDHRKIPAKRVDNSKFHGYSRDAGSHCSPIRPRPGPDISSLRPTTESVEDFMQSESMHDHRRPPTGEVGNEQFQPHGAIRESLSQHARQFRSEKNHETFNPHLSHCDPLLPQPRAYIGKPKHSNQPSKGAMQSEAMYNRRRIPYELSEGMADQPTQRREPRNVETFIQSDGHRGSLLPQPGTNSSSLRAAYQREQNHDPRIPAVEMRNHRFNPYGPFGKAANQASQNVETSSRSGGQRGPLLPPPKTSTGNLRLDCQPAHDRMCSSQRW